MDWLRSSVTSLKQRNQLEKARNKSSKINDLKNDIKNASFLNLNLSKENDFIKAKLNQNNFKSISSVFMFEIDRLNKMKQLLFLQKRSILHLKETHSNQLEQGNHALSLLEATKRESRMVLDAQGYMNLQLPEISNNIKVNTDLLDSLGLKYESLLIEKHQLELQYNHVNTILLQKQALYNNFNKKTKMLIQLLNNIESALKRYQQGIQERFNLIESNRNWKNYQALNLQIAGIVFSFFTALAFLNYLNYFL